MDADLPLDGRGTISNDAPQFTPPAPRKVEQKCSRGNETKGGGLSVSFNREKNSVWTIEMDRKTNNKEVNDGNNQAARAVRGSREFHHLLSSPNGLLLQLACLLVLWRLSQLANSRPTD